MKRLTSYVLVALLALGVSTTALAEKGIMDTVKDSVSTSTTYVSDSAITGSVKAAIYDAIKSNVKVKTTNGVVVLKGSLASQDEINKAINAAKTVEGVKSVKSKLTITKAKK